MSDDEWLPETDSPKKKPKIDGRSLPSGLS